MKIQPADKKIQPADKKIQPADKKIQPADKKIQPADKKIQPAEFILHRPVSRSEETVLTVVTHRHQRIRLIDNKMQRSDDSDDKKIDSGKRQRAY